jgi:hypothetical protein
MKPMKGVNMYVHGVKTSKLLANFNIRVHPYWVRDIEKGTGFNIQRWRITFKKRVEGEFWFALQSMGLWIIDHGEFWLEFEEPMF